MNKGKLSVVIGFMSLPAGLTAGAQVYVRVGPPLPPREVVPPPVHLGWVWHPGYHHWDGAHYVWVPGEYVAPPRAGVRWVPGHWRNSPRGYVWWKALGVARCGLQGVVA